MCFFSSSTCAFSFPAPPPFDPEVGLLGWARSGVLGVMSNPVIDPPFSAASEDQITQIITHAESVLQSQLTVALAGDQRALTFAGFIAAAAAALVGGAAVLLIGKDNHFVGYLALSASLGLLISMAAAVYSSRPASFEWAGTEPATWYGDIEAGMSVPDSLRQLAAHYQEMIVSNRATLDDGSKWLRRAQWIALATLLTTGLIFTVSFVLRDIGG